MIKRTYADLMRFDTFKDRYEYLKLGGRVGEATFGFERYINQMFYTSAEWRTVRHHVIARDLGCDLGFEGYEVNTNPYIHHLNPMTKFDIESGDPSILDPEFLITTSQITHNAIHYGNVNTLPRLPVERKPGDTKLW